MHVVYTLFEKMGSTIESMRGKEEGKEILLSSWNWKIAVTE